MCEEILGDLENDDRSHRRRVGRLEVMIVEEFRVLLQKKDRLRRMFPSPEL